MQRLLFSLVAIAGCAPLSAQTQVLLPNVTTWSASNEPLAGAAPKRYQQWFAPSHFQQTVGRPVRITGLDFAAWTPGGQTGGPMDIEVTMYLAPTTIPFSFVTQNPVVVVPRATYTLGTAIPGSFPLSFNFKAFGSEFIWDGSSGVVVDLKIWNNGRGTQSYQYDLQTTLVGGASLNRMWALGPDPRALSTPTFTQIGVGAAMRFTYEDGVTISYGAGCPGAGGFVPLAATSGGHPLPANNAWAITVSKANSQIGAVLLFGASDMVFNGTQLPINLSFLNLTGCSLWTDILLTRSTMAIGGGPGLGMAGIAVPIPAVTIFRGLSMYTQWLLLDPQAFNLQLAMSQAQRHVFG